MARAGIPPGGQFPFSQKQLESFLSDVIEGGGELGVDRRKLYGKVFGEIYLSDEESFTPSTRGATDEFMGAGFFFAPTEYQNSQTATEEDITGAPTAGASFAVKDIPTSSTNYSRPRTVAAGYTPNPEDANNGTMTVVFRDGTFYNYYQVSPSEWQSFQASYSKGRPWLNKGKPGWKQTSDGLFVGKPRGNADLTKVDPAIREALYRVARTQQVKSPPKAGKTFSSATLADGSTMAVRNNLRSANKAHAPHKAHKAPTGKRKAS